MALYKSCGFDEFKLEQHIQFEHQDSFVELFERLQLIVWQLEQLVQCAKQKQFAVVQQWWQ